MTGAQQSFGGDWTSEKLERVRKYLKAYTTVMNKQNFRFAYIDAFAGTGYRTLETSENDTNLLFPELAEQESQTFIDGSARIALEVQPRFSKYIFIECDPARFAELEQLKTEYPLIRDDIILVNSDANDYVKELCLKRDWRRRRAVLFLDPFGMQVTWDTIEAVAQTRAIDLWILFPLGVAVNRLIKKDGKISETWRRKLDAMFGATDWYEAFYRPKVVKGLFGEESSMEKVSDFDFIGQYFVKRLKSLFAGVAENPLPLLNSKNNPLYLLCFASANPKGSTTAIKIAQDILRR
ncbi:MAG TPA: three-Cys-motif partner protein TcmP [Pyrinomonadaceae bacterium]|nr:three-Cys-motif partner protein TcmP [Pyrinomonadaceae bacterium]